jgi:DNA-binding Lrp family transcriptional regulator
MSTPTPPERPAAGRTVDLDDTDHRILAELRADGRMSMRTLAERVHISRASAYNRVQRLEQRGVITSYTAVIDPERAGYGISALIYLKVSQHSWKTIRQHVMDIPEVWQAALVAGDHDLVLLIRVRDTQTLRDLVLARLQTLPGVVSTQTALVLDEIPQERVVPAP